MYNVAQHAMRLSRESTGHIQAAFSLSTATMSSVRRLQSFLQSPEARRLNCTSEECGHDRVLSIILNPTHNPEEMPIRLKEFKEALKGIVGGSPIETDYSGLH
jgi:hypothetical protein